MHAILEDGHRYMHPEELKDLSGGAAETPRLFFRRKIKA